MKNNHLYLELPSNLLYVDIIESFFWKYLEVGNIVDKINGHELFVAVIEAVVNGIKHGNKNDEKKIITFKINQKNDKIIFKVKDLGKGFNPDSVVDPTNETNIKKDNGRGIFLMKKLMDEVKFNFKDSGTEIVMIKKLK